MTGEVLREAERRASKKENIKLSLNIIGNQCEEKWENGRGAFIAAKSIIVAAGAPLDLARRRLNEERDI